MEEPLPQRKRPARFAPIEAFNRSNVILISVCTDRRRPLLARAQVVSLLIDAWRQSPTWLVGRYVVLPDHLHLFCAPASDEPPPLANWIKFWKSSVSRRWPWPEEQPVWQQSFWDRQLRTSEHYSGRWDYVRNNPVRHGLVTSSENWPWQGELNAFQFHD